MTSVFSLDQIIAALPDVDVVSEVEAGFAAFSRGEVTVPPVGELLFPDVQGEMHIKYGAVRGDDVFVIKVATGFFGNPALGLPPFGGCMLVLSQKTGMVEAVLLEEGELTNHRTAAAGAVAARHLAPGDVDCIGIIGSGVQARLQADYLRRVSPCRRLMIWGRREASRSAAARDIAAMGYAVEEANSPEDVAKDCRLIVTTTPAETPLLSADMIAPGTHITAMGSDTPDKNEVSPDLLGRADLVVADSLAQCRERGEIFHALAAGTIAEGDVTELGAIIEGSHDGRPAADAITISDLTGVAVQDIAIAKAVLARLTQSLEAAQ
ncbi:MAG: ornithine cyclodeaminase family protein [Roseitalea sp.]|nr:ornithine cyclodeaminase family protein [Roseitalea sp.]MBO6721665.1 ornithine cyclodeaminase family protein [Roseitalea sp.]MBO6743547.1 ornithine cyclodeaminase family protein [Roseitalea sp.]